MKAGLNAVGCQFPLQRASWLSCRRESGEQLRCALAGFANPVSRGGSRRRPLRDGSLYRRTGQHGAGPFQYYGCYFWGAGPRLHRRIQADQAFVCRFFDFQLTVPEVPSQQAQCSVGLAYYLVDVAWPREVVTDCHAKVWVVLNSLQDTVVHAVADG